LRQRRNHASAHTKSTISLAVDRVWLTFPDMQLRAFCDQGEEDLPGGCSDVTLVLAIANEANWLWCLRVEPISTRVHRGVLDMIRMLQMILDSVKVRDSYPTRIWTALFFPVFTGTVFGWSTRTKLEALMIGVLVALAYTAAEWINKKYLR
jgi:hypothetical protein